MIVEINALIERYHGAVDFVFIYILEAHATDEWPVAGINDSIAQHKTCADRAAAAVFYRTQYHVHEAATFLLDSEDNAFNRAYSSWPTRYWTIDRGRVAVKMMPEPGDNTITLNALSDWLKERFD
jgi:hypothetical protein